MFAEVIVEYPIKNLDKTFTYHIPDNLKDKLQVGMKVIVPFHNSTLGGFVLAIKENNLDSIIAKDIIAIQNEELVMPSELLSLATYLCQSTLCTKITAFQTMLPSSLKVGKKKSDYSSYQKIIKLNPAYTTRDEYIHQNMRFSNQMMILNRLKEEKAILKKEIVGSALNTLIKNGLVIEEKVSSYRLNQSDQIREIKTLTVEQEKAYQQIKQYFNHPQTILFHGITGSGKTEVYIKLIEDIIKEHQTALVLVPEIGLTTQIALRFYRSFASDVAILHSSLSMGEKYDEYLKILRGEVHVVVGTRSAIFAPLKNLGLIIIDEEDSSAYKQDNHPKYNAKDLALFRAQYNKIPLILASATPALETKARADKGIFALVTLTKRVGTSKLPLVHVVAMEKEMQKRNMIFSDLLQQKISEKLAKKEQIILLLNRRGYATFINCSNCGYVYKCPNCAISLTYHKKTNKLVCHYCGYQIIKKETCPKCGENSLNYYGLGTEKLESELQKLYPEAKIIRMDQDVTSKKGMHEKIINDFKAMKYDILLGTQMVSKGLDFPKVTLVGVINADATLNIPDFRSNENTFALLHQVAGRAGRSTTLGEVVIQTFNPDNFVIQCVQNNDYNRFYLQEMQIRRNLKYPPYYYLVSLKVISKNYNLALTEAQKVKNYLDHHLLKETIILGPTTAAILKFKDEYRFQIILKYKYDQFLVATLKELDNIYAQNKDCYLDIDFNPSHI